MPNDEIALGLEYGTVFPGEFSKPYRHSKRAFVKISSLNQDILIEEYEHEHRAIAGDTVIVKINPIRQWKMRSHITEDVLEE